MCLDSILTLMGLQRQQQEKTMACNMANIAMGMIIGLTAGAAVTYCCTENAKSRKFRRFKKKSSDTFENVMDAAENFQQKAEEVKDGIKCRYHKVKRDVEDTVDKVSDLYGESPD
jgi:sensor c-di-GMP phosphodiesterase-like protein